MNKINKQYIFSISTIILACSVEIRRQFNLFNLHITITKYYPARHLIFTIMNFFIFADCFIEVEMGKPCAYPGCRTGRRAVRAERTRAGLRQLSVFQVPGVSLLLYIFFLFSTVKHLAALLSIQSTRFPCRAKNRIAVPPSALLSIMQSIQQTPANCVMNNCR